MLDNIRPKIRALVEDFSKSSFETFTYTTSAIFTIAQENITITKVLKNGIELGSGEYDFDEDTNKIEIVVALSSGDIIEVDYTYYKYSDSELNEYVKASLVWLSIESYCSVKDYEVEDDDIYPTPDNKTLDLIAIISSILIKPSYSEYRLPNLTVRYPESLSKEDKIQKLIRRFNSSIGITDVLEWD